MRINISGSISIITLFLFSLVLISCSKEKKTEVLDENSEGIPILFETQFSEIKQVMVKISVAIVQGEPVNIQSIGLVWSDSPNPTQSDNLVEANTGSQSFEVTLDYLHANTRYYVRPFLVDNSGVIYGEEAQFTSLEHLVFTGDIILSTQSEVDDFGAMGYTKIAGSLSFAGEQVNNVRSLSSLLDVGSDGEGGLDFSYTACTSLEGLDNVRRIGGLFFYENQNLSNMEGLGKLKIVTGPVFTQSNGFINFQGMSSLESIGIGVDFPNGFFVVNETSLRNFLGLENLQTVEGIFKVENCFAMQNFEGLNGLKTLDRGFQVWGTSSPNFTGMDSLESTGFLWVRHSWIESFDGLRSLTTIENFMTVFFNSQLVNFEGLQSLQNIGDGVSIDSNDSLVSLDGLETFENIGGRLDIVNNDVLVDYCGIQNLFTNDGFPYVIMNNAYNPTREDIINGNCRL